MIGYGSGQLRDWWWWLVDGSTRSLKVVNASWCFIVAVANDASRMTNAGTPSPPSDHLPKLWRLPIIRRVAVLIRRQNGWFSQKTSEDAMRRWGRYPKSTSLGTTWGPWQNAGVFNSWFLSMLGETQHVSGLTEMHSFRKLEIQKEIDHRKPLDDWALWSRTRIFLSKCSPIFGRWPIPISNRPISYLLTSVHMV